MKRLIRIAFATAVLVILPCAAGTHSRVRARVPPFSSVWNLIPGSGARYEVVDRSGQKFTLELSIVGKEIVSGKDTYWMEVSSQPEPPNIGTVAKMLLYRDGKEVVFTGPLIQQVPGDVAVEVLPFNYVADYLRIAAGYRIDPHQWGVWYNDDFGQLDTMLSNGDQPTDNIPGMERIGSEDVTTSAGTFSCEHFRYKHNAGDVWVAAGVVPFGLVKARTKNQTSMLLTKSLSEVKDNCNSDSGVGDGEKERWRGS